MDNSSLITSRGRIVSNSSSNSSMNESMGEDSPGKRWSFSNMIALALKNSSTGQLVVSDIYEFIYDHFPYYRTDPNSWKNSVRHNLSHNAKFQKIEVNDGNGRQRFEWSIVPAKEAKINADLAKCGWEDPSAGINKYSFTPKERTVKRLTDKKPLSSKYDVNTPKSRSALLSRRNAKGDRSTALEYEEGPIGNDKTHCDNDGLIYAASSIEHAVGVFDFERNENEEHRNFPPFDTFPIDYSSNIFPVTFQFNDTPMIEHDITAMANL